MFGFDPLYSYLSAAGDHRNLQKANFHHVSVANSFYGALRSVFKSNKVVGDLKRDDEIQNDDAIKSQNNIVD